MEVHANSPRKVSDETEVGARGQVGEHRIRSRSGRCVHNLRCQQGEAVGMGRGEAHRRVT